MRPIAKSVIPFVPGSYTNGATASGNIDCKGAEYLELDVMTSTSNDATNNPSVLKLSESDDTVVTNFADIAAFVGDGAGGFTIPAAETATTTPWVVKMRVDLRGRKRYLKLSVTPITTQIIAASGSLHLKETAPVGTTEANVAALAEG